jgi:hypothetical protein
VRRLVQENCFELIHLSKLASFSEDWEELEQQLYLAKQRQGSRLKGGEQLPTPSVGPPPAPPLPKQWREILLECGLPEDAAVSVEQQFLENRLEPDQVEDLTMELMKEMGLKVGHILKIRRWIGAQMEKTK